jgi:ATP-binding cassette subfamily F protein 3
MILQVSQINKSFGTDVILDNVSFHIEDNEKAALIGINGAGKSTLFKIIVGEMQADDGNVIISKDKKLGYLAQHQDFSSENTIYDEILAMKQDILDLETKIFMN